MKNYAEKTQSQAMGKVMSEGVNQEPAPVPVTDTLQQGATVPSFWDKLRMAKEVAKQAVLGGDQALAPAPPAAAPALPVEQAPGIDPRGIQKPVVAHTGVTMPTPKSLQQGLAGNIQQEAEGQRELMGAQAGTTQAKADIDAAVAEHKALAFEEAVAAERERISEQIAGNIQEAEAKIAELKPEKGFLSGLMRFIGLSLMGGDAVKLLELEARFVENETKKVMETLKVRSNAIKPLVAADIMNKIGLAANAMAKDLYAKNKVDQARELIKMAQRHHERRSALQEKMFNSEFDAKMKTYKQKIDESLDVEQGTVVKTSSVKNSKETHKLLNIPGEKDRSYYSKMVTPEDSKRLKISLSTVKDVIKTLEDYKSHAMTLAGDKKSIMYTDRLSFDKWNAKQLKGLWILIEKERRNLGVLQKLDIDALMQVFMSDPTGFFVSPERVAKEFNSLISGIESEAASKLDTYGYPGWDSRLWRPTRTGKPKK